MTDFEILRQKAYHASNYDVVSVKNRAYRKGVDKTIELLKEKLYPKKEIHANKTT